MKVSRFTKFFVASALLVVVFIVVAYVHIETEYRKNVEVSRKELLLFDEYLNTLKIKSSE